MKTAIVIFSFLAIFSLVIPSTNAQPSIKLELLEPTGGDVEVYKTEGFNVAVNVTCLNGDCGGINISLDPQYLFTDSFESANFSSEWSVTDHFGRSSSRSSDGTWSMASDSDGGSYGNSWSDTVTSNPIDFSGCTEAYLTFDYWYDIEYNSNCNYDYGYFQASSDGGSTWNNLNPDTSESEDGITGVFCGESGGYTGIEGSDEQWNSHSPINMSNYCGNSSVKLRFGFGSDGSVTHEGFYIDNIKINYTSGTKGLVSTDSSSETFWTNKSSNPYLINLSEDESEVVNFWVNASGDVNLKEEFFVYANLTSNASISNKTERWNVTILGANVSIDLVSPTGDLEVMPGDTFSVTVNVSCNAGNCRNVNVTLDPVYPETCNEVSGSSSGVYTIYPNGSSNPVSAYCDLETEGGGWTLFANAGPDSCAESLSMGSNNLNDTSTLYMTNLYGDTNHTQWMLRHFDAGNLTHTILFNFSSEKKLKNRFNDLIASGESVPWIAYNTSNNRITGNLTSYRYSDNAGITSANWYSRTDASDDDGAWGVMNNTGLDGNSGPYLDGNSDPRFGFENKNSGDSVCNTYYTGYSSTYSTNWVANIFFRNGGGSSSKGGAIPATPGATPFWTNKSSNPLTITLDENESQEITFWVNASGSGGNTYEFYAYAELVYNTSLQDLTDKWNVTIIDTSNIPTVNLESPEDDYMNSNGNISFEFNATCSEPILNCSVYMNGVEKGSNSNIQLNTSETINVTGISSDIYSWYIECISDSSVNGSSDTRELEVLLSQGFNENSTNLSQVDTENITNLYLEKTGIGSVNFTENVNISGSQDLSTIVQINPTNITVDSSTEPRLNKTATLKLYNLPYQFTPKILRDRSICPSGDCNIVSYNPSTGTLVFTVNHFTTYAASANSQLTLEDDTDNVYRNSGENVYFYANYTNLTSNAPISGAGIKCEIRFDMSGYTAYTDMTYNGTSHLYEYNRSFPSTGTYDWNVYCNGSASNYEPINTTDEAVIGDPGGTSPAGATVTNERNFGEYQPRAPGNVDIESGNITGADLDTNMSTYRWAGLLGNTSGNLVLGDSDNETMYTWTAEGRLVYLCNTTNIIWAALSDAQEEHVPNYLRGSSSDSYSNTFSGSEAIDSGIFSINSDYATTLSAEATTWKTYSLRSGPNIIWVGKVESTGKSYSNSTVDYQMIIPEDGRSGNEVPSTYYIWLELG